MSDKPKGSVRCGARTIWFLLIAGGVRRFPVKSGQSTRPPVNPVWRLSHGLTPRVLAGIPQDVTKSLADH